MFGKGEIKIDSNFKEGYQGYLQALKEEKGWTGAFAADNDGCCHVLRRESPDRLICLDSIDCRWKFAGRRKLLKCLL